MYTDELVNDLLITALEGGANYWLAGIEYHNVQKRDGNKDPRYAQLNKNLDGHLIITISEEGDDNDGTKHKLTFEGFKKGIELMHDKYPRHYGDFISEDFDAVTADVALQCAVLGEVIYG
jgi:hypothetical protein